MTDLSQAKIEELTGKAEGRIQAILIELEAETAMCIGNVTVDTRNWGRLAVEILLEKGTRR